MKKILIPLATSLLTLTMLTGCNSENSSSSEELQQTESPAQMEVGAVDGSNIDGFYVAKFKTLNSHVNGTVPGSASFHRNGDRFMAYVRLFAGYPKAWHMQYVYSGDRCPEMSDDLNGDGFIDIEEAEAVMGKILIPLDSDISSQSSGRRFFPLADASGSYQYERSASFRRMLSDLQSQRLDPTGDMTKLAPGEGLVITGRPVVILGVSEDVQLPETVATKWRQKSYQTFPIACGVFEKSNEALGKPYNEEDGVPGPIAEVEEDQDRPSTAPIPEEPTDPKPETPGDETTTNDSHNGRGPVSDGESSRTEERRTPRRDSTPNEETTPETPTPSPEESSPESEPVPEIGSPLETPSPEV